MNEAEKLFEGCGTTQLIKNEQGKVVKILENDVEIFTSKEGISIEDSYKFIFGKNIDLETY